MRCLKSAVAWCLIAITAGHFTAFGDTKKGEEDPEAAIQALLVTGGASHDYAVRKDIITRGIRERVSKKIEWMVRFQGAGESDAKIPLFESAAWAEGYDIVIHDYCFPRVRDGEYIRRILAPHAKGLPAVLLHGTMHSFKSGDEAWFEFCGITSRRHDENYPLTIQPVMPLNPVWGELDSWMTPAGQLYLVDSILPGTTVLGNALQRGTAEEHPVVWQHRYGAGSAKVFGMTPGNDISTMVQPEFLDVLTRGFLWALGDSGRAQFKPVPPEDSLSGFTIPVQDPDLPDVGASALRFAEASTLTPGAVGDLSFAERLRAADGKSNTAWSPEKPGPSVWEGRLQEESDLCAVAVLWSRPPAEYSISTSRDGKHWEPVIREAGAKEKDASFYEFEKRKAGWIRVDLLKSGGSLPTGIREVAGYASMEDVPSAILLDTPSDKAGQPLLSLEDSRVGNGFLLSSDWKLDVLQALPSEVTPLALVPASAGSVFLLAGKEGDKPARSVLFCRKEKDSIETNVFLDEISPEGIITWDGEWLHVFDKGKLELFRDTNGDGRADERHSVGSIFSGESPAGGLTFHDLLAGPDRWLYASFSSTEKREIAAQGGKVLSLPPHGILRFGADMTDPKLVIASPKEITSFFVDQEIIGLVNGDGGFTVNRNAASISRLGEPAFPGACLMARGPHKSLWFFIEAARLVGMQEYEGGMLSKVLARIPRIEQVVFDEEGNGWFVRKGSGSGGRQLGVLSGVKQAPFPDLNRVPTEELPGLLSRGNDLQKESVAREILRRKRVPVAPLEALLEQTQGEKVTRDVVLSLLVELDGDGGMERIARWCRSESAELRAAAFFLLGDHPKAANHPAFSRLEKESEPAVTAAILDAIVRSGSDSPGVNAFVMKLATTPDPVVSRAAKDFLIRREASAICFEVLENGNGEQLWPAAFDIVTGIYRQTVAEKLGELLARTTHPGFRRQCLTALCAFYYHEGEQTWESSPLIGSLLRASLSDHRVDRPHLVDTMIAHRIPFELKPLVGLAKEDLTLEPFVVNQLTKRNPAVGVTPWLETIQRSESRDYRLRRTALVAMAGVNDGDVFMRTLDRISEVIDGADWSGAEKRELVTRWRENPARSQKVEALIEITRSENEKRRFLAWQPLLSLRDDLKSEDAHSHAVVKRIDEVLASDRDAAESMLLAMKEVSSFELARAMAVIESGEDEAVKSFVAGSIFDSLLLELEGAAQHRILEAALEREGDAQAGYEWFNRNNCSACHNIHGEGPSLGPDFSFLSSGLDLESIFESLISPSASVQDSFLLKTFEMKNGRRLYGVNERRDGDQISMIDTAGNGVSFSVSEVHREWSDGKSIMPPLKSGSMTPSDLADLKAFLDSLVIPAVTKNEGNQ